jgi:hypothetical protein
MRRDHRGDHDRRLGGRMAGMGGRMAGVGGHVAGMDGGMAGMDGKGKVELPGAPVELPRAPVTPRYAPLNLAPEDVEDAPGSLGDSDLTEDDMIRKILDPGTVRRIHGSLLALVGIKRKKYERLQTLENDRLRELKRELKSGRRASPVSGSADSFGNQLEELVLKLREVQGLLEKQEAWLKTQPADGYVGLMAKLRDAIEDTDAVRSAKRGRGITSLTGSNRADLRRKLLKMILSLSVSPAAFLSSNAWILTGPAGTGKNSVAETLAHVFGRIGVLASGTFLSPRVSDIVSSPVGKTAERMRSILTSSIESVLFLDEVYRLATHCQIQHPDGSFGKPAEQDFGVEAANETLQFLEGDYRGLMVLVIAGYTSHVQCFLSINEGLKRRFSDWEQLGPPSTADLTQILVDVTNQKLRDSSIDPNGLNQPEQSFVHRLIVSFRTEDSANHAERGGRGGYLLQNQAGDIATLGEYILRSVTQSAALNASRAWNARRGIADVDVGNLRTIGDAFRNFATLKGRPDVTIKVPRLALIKVPRLPVVPFVGRPDVTIDGPRLPVVRYGGMANKCGSMSHSANSMFTLLTFDPWPLHHFIHPIRSAGGSNVPIRFTARP